MDGHNAPCHDLDSTLRVAQALLQVDGAIMTVLNGFANGVPGFTNVALGASIANGKAVARLVTLAEGRDTDPRFSTPLFVTVLDYLRQLSSPSLSRLSSLVADKPGFIATVSNAVL